MSRSGSNTNLFRYKGPLRVIAFITLWSFLFTNIGGEYLLEKAWAARTPLELTTAGSNRAGSLGTSQELSVETFTLPEYLGNISAIHKANSDKTIIHIQDAHCNYYAQHKISEIIGYLNKEYDIESVNLEGGKGKYDLSIFTSIQDKVIREKVADYFVKEGIVNGGEYFFITNPGKLCLWGIEDTELYLESLKAYIDSLKHKETIDKYLSSLTHILNNLKRHIYSPELLELDKKSNRYKNGDFILKKYLLYLLSLRKRPKAIPSLYPNLHLLRQSLGKEKEIYFRQANSERNRLIRIFQKMFSKSVLEEIALKSAQFKAGRISERHFYTYLFDKAKLITLDLTSFPELQKYASYISTYEEIDKSKIQEEIEELECNIKEGLYRNDKERKLDTLSKNLTIMENMLKLQLIKKDYDYYRANKDSFDMQNFISFIEKETPLHNITVKPDTNTSELDYHLENMAGCYTSTFKRDEAFLRNMKLKDVSIFVTGGFHTENLKKLCETNNISYISIMPNFKVKDNYECPYFALLSGRGLLNAAIAYADPFTELGSIVSKRIYGRPPGKVREICRQRVEKIAREGTLSPSQGPDSEKLKPKTSPEKSRPVAPGPQHPTAIHGFNLWLSLGIALVAPLVALFIGTELTWTESLLTWAGLVIMHEFVGHMLLSGLPLVMLGKAHLKDLIPKRGPWGGITIPASKGVFGGIVGIVTTYVAMVFIHYNFPSIATISKIIAVIIVLSLSDWEAVESIYATPHIKKRGAKSITTMPSSKRKQQRIIHARIEKFQPTVFGSTHSELDKITNLHKHAQESLGRIEAYFPHIETQKTKGEIERIVEMAKNELEELQLRMDEETERWGMRAIENWVDFVPKTVVGNPESLIIESLHDDCERAFSSYTEKKKRVTEQAMQQICSAYFTCIEPVDIERDIYEKARERARGNPDHNIHKQIHLVLEATDEEIALINDLTIGPTEGSRSKRAPPRQLDTPLKHFTGDVLVTLSRNNFDLKEAETALSVGPGTVPTEITELLRVCPRLKSVEILTIDLEDRLDGADKPRNLLRHLRDYLQTHSEIKTEFYVYKTTVMHFPKELKEGSVDIALMFNVVDTIPQSKGFTFSGAESFRKLSAQIAFRGLAGAIREGAIYLGGGMFQIGPQDCFEERENPFDVLQEEKPWAWYGVSGVYRKKLLSEEGEDVTDLIGKLYKSSTVQNDKTLARNIHVEKEGDTLRFFRRKQGDERKRPLYDKYGREVGPIGFRHEPVNASVTMLEIEQATAAANLKGEIDMRIAKMILKALRSKQVFILEDNPHGIRGAPLYGTDEIYLVESMARDPERVFHEVGESLKREIENITWINAHTYLRGCGKDAVTIIEAKGPHRLGDAASMMTELYNKFDDDRFNDHEYALMNYNEKCGYSPDKLTQGLQEKIFRQVKRVVVGEKPDSAEPSSEENEEIAIELAAQFPREVTEVIIPGSEGGHFVVSKSVTSFLTNMGIDFGSRRGIAIMRRAGEIVRAGEERLASVPPEKIARGFLQKIQDGIPIRIYGKDEEGDRYYTYEELAGKGLVPIYTIEFGEDEYYLSQPFMGTDGRVCFACYFYHVNSRTGKRMLFVNGYYKSNSQGIWRAASHRVGRIWIGKGLDEAYQDLPVEIYPQLEQIVLSVPSPALAPHLLDDLLGPGIPSRPGDSQLDTQLGASRKAGKILVAEGDLSKRQDPNLQNHHFRFSMGYEPVFSPGGILRQFESSNDLYGKITHYLIRSRNGRIQYLFNVDQEGCVWIGTIQSYSYELDRQGVRVDRQNYFVARALLMPVYEYKSNMPQGYEGVPHPQYRFYADASEYLDKIDVIREFKERVLKEEDKNVAKEGIDELTQIHPYLRRAIEEGHAASVQNIIDIDLEELFGRGDEAIVRYFLSQFKGLSPQAQANLELHLARAPTRERLYQGLLNAQAALQNSSQRESLSQYRIVILLDDENTKIPGLSHEDLLGHAGAGRKTKLNTPPTIFLSLTTLNVGQANNKGLLHLFQHEDADFCRGYHEWQNEEEETHIRSLWDDVAAEEIGVKGEEITETRQANNVKSLLKDKTPGRPVRVVVARPARKDADSMLEGPIYDNTAVDISKAMADNGFGVLNYYPEYGNAVEMDKRKQVIPFAIDTEAENRDTARTTAVRNIIEAIEDGLDGLPPDGSVVAYLPQIVGGLQIFKIIDGRLVVDEEIKGYFQSGLDANRLILVPDGYIDLKYPDYFGRLVLGRNMTQYYRSTGNDRLSALIDINWQLTQLGSDPGIVYVEQDGSLHFLQALKIRPIDYDEDINQWRRTQKEAATAL